MTTNRTEIEKLIEKVELYSKTSVELFKCNTIFKSAEICSSLAANLVLIIVVIMFSLFLNIGLALWIGRLLGELYYGFLVIAFIYFLIGILVYSFRNNWIKKPVSKFIITKLQK
jgi:hypothetical protein